MADVINEPEEKGKGGGNKNALAYGLLQGEGYNTDGMSPKEAWALVDKLKLLIRGENKKTKRDKGEYDKANADAKNSGVTKNKVIQKAGVVAKRVSLHSDNIAGLNIAIDTIKGIIDEYSLRNLKKISTKKHIGNKVRSAAACANGESITIGNEFLNNPTGFYRRTNVAFRVNNQKYQQQLQHDLNIASQQNDIQKINDLQNKLAQVRENLMYTRSNVCYQGAEIESVITHETGHVIADQLFGQINGRKCLLKGITDKEIIRKQKIVKECYDNSIANGDIYKISKYAKKDDVEFFAEAFCIYKIGREKLPEPIENMIKQCLA